MYDKTVLQALRENREVTDKAIVAVTALLEAHRQTGYKMEAILDELMLSRAANEETAVIMGFIPVPEQTLPRRQGINTGSQEILS